MTLKTRIILLITLIPATSLLVLMLMLSKEFTRDKTAYIFELQDETLKRVHVQVHKLLSDENNWINVYLLKDKQIEYIGPDTDLKHNLTKLTNYVNFVCKPDQNYSYFFDQSNQGWFCRCKEDADNKILSILPLSKLASFLQVNSLQTLFLIHSNGVILASEKTADVSKDTSKSFPDIQTQLANKKTTGHLAGKQDNVSVIGSFELMDLPNLVLVSISPKNAADQATYPFLLKGLLALGVILVFVISAGSIIGRSINQQVTTLLDAFRDYGSGKEDLRLPIKENSKDEFQSLMSGFNGMADKIQILVKDKESIAAVKHEMKMAGEVQNMFFPSGSKIIDNLKIDGTVWSADDCGGDWWHTFTKDTKVIITFGDVTGHGFKAALMTGAARAIMSEMEVKYTNLPEIAYAINRTLLDMSHAAFQMTFFGIEYDMETKKYRYINCSHEPSIVFQKVNGVLNPEFLSSVSGPRLGESINSVFEDEEIDIKDPLAFVIFSDGLRELNNPDKKPLGDRRLINIFKKSLDVTPAARVSFIEQQIKEFQNNEPLLDDASFVLISVQNSES